MLLKYLQDAWHDAVPRSPDVVREDGASFADPNIISLYDTFIAGAREEEEESLYLVLEHGGIDSHTAYTCQNNDGPITPQITKLHLCDLSTLFRV